MQILAQLEHMNSFWQSTWYNQIRSFSRQRPISLSLRALFVILLLWETLKSSASFCGKRSSPSCFRLPSTADFVLKYIIVKNNSEWNYLTWNTEEILISHMAPIYYIVLLVLSFTHNAYFNFKWLMLSFLLLFIFILQICILFTLKVENKSWKVTFRNPAVFIWITGQTDSAKLLTRASYSD